MNSARIYVHGILAAFLEKERNAYRIEYLSSYRGEPISLTLPIREEPYVFDHFPSFFEGLLPEGLLLEGLLRNCKLDEKDYFGQILAVGQDLVGSVTIEKDR
ncbi:MAG: HipA N-terminal domain-containing protein [Proteobacteria bacterium]|nr:HipA N-terminal domain-containing protein [Pseudomonadota bacterium]